MIVEGRLKLYCGTTHTLPYCHVLVLSNGHKKMSRVDHHHYC